MSRGVVVIPPEHQEAEVDHGAVWDKMKALHGDGGAKKKKAKRRKSEYRNASMGEIGVMAMQAAQATAEAQVREAMARLARAEAAQQKLQARLERTLMRLRCHSPAKRRPWSPW